MERVQWLERSLRVLSQHYGRPLIVQFGNYGFGDDVLLLARSFIPGDCIADTVGEGTDLGAAVEAGIRQLTDEQILAAEALLPPEKGSLMPSPDSDLSTETTEQVGERLEAFAHRLHTLIQSEPKLGGLAGALLGYGVGMMLCHQNTETEIRQAVSNVLDAALVGARSITDHERKTFS